MTGGIISPTEARRRGLCYATLHPDDDETLYCGTHGGPWPCGSDGPASDGPASDAPVSGRHPATRELLGWFDYAHLPAGQIRDTSALCRALARAQVAALPDGPELSTGLRKLLEAKDCFVRAAVSASREAAQP